ncbi:MAG: methionine--tRNA ligase [Candidatus Saccharibacteria bacterium]|nr:methionine--tRNA ligase [Candidatus Saccharibacteria bacterium]MCA9339347.1 methionine--tRNA ligase [Candidatus Saccharibacteria bacterium]HPQ82534.1 methionine--tRNA ligase [Candidatus Saccharimonas sp.]
MKKNLYISTAIPYVNGVPHIGHAMDYLLADIWARYQRQNGKEVRFQIGTDEHGTKNAAKAAELGLTPQAYVDQASQPFKAMAEKVGSSYTDFIRTTDAHHRGAVQYIWQQLAPHIYKDRYEGWYCSGCEQFYTDKEVEVNGGNCPNHKTPFERLSEENYYLRASDFTDQIRSAIETNKLRIIPEFRKKEILELIKDGVKDVSISRPRKSLSWGVGVPGDDSQVMYVWLDALSNYITVLGYPDDASWQEYWPADVQVVGKDILRFHAIIWPAILLGIGVSLPKRLLVHGFVNIGGEKISKSLGNGIDPNQIIDSYGRDAFRYFFSCHIPTTDDGDFTWEKFENAYNNELGNDLGNLVQRIAAMVTRYQAGVIGDSPQAEHDMGPYHEAMEQFRYNDAVNIAWNTVRSLNQYLESVKPWEIAKNREKDTEAAEHLSDVLAHAASTLLQVADLLTPFMPDTADVIKHSFGTGVVPADIQPLFPKIYLHTPDPRAPKAAPAQS